MGDNHKAQEIRAELSRQKEDSRNTQFLIAMLDFALGDRDRGFASLVRAYEDDAPMVRFLKCGLFPEDVRSDARYIALLQRMGLT